MEYFTEKVFSFIQKYPIETVLIIISVLAFIGAFLFTQRTNDFEGSTVTLLHAQGIQPPPITVDIAGAVKKPGIYSFKQGARIGEAIEAAGGLSPEANRQYVEQHLNLSQLLQDQDKVYVPYGNEDFYIASSQTETIQKDNLVNINTDSKTDLEKLPGVGPVTADKIVSSRPYRALEELHTKGVISRKLYDKIHNLIRL